MGRRLIAALALVLLPAAALAVDPENVLVIEIEGEARGEVRIELLPEVAPLHAERIRLLAREGAYDGVAFHRVIDGFMAQTGDVVHGRPGGDASMIGTGGSDYGNLPAEFSALPFERGTVGMARGPHPDSGNSQFFIMFARAPHLDRQYTVVGRVMEGQEVVDAIRRGAPPNGLVATPDRMVRVRIMADD